MLTDCLVGIGDKTDYPEKREWLTGWNFEQVSTLQHFVACLASTISKTEKYSGFKS